ncbi:MAG: hypothetical protein Q7R30_06700 [Acidobacteriota bacterium]|nr:hypothetical protein [Acidobacteriota bacterium]
MRPIFAVATLDLRRLWMPVGAAGVAIGLFPALTRGLPVHASAQDTFPFALGIAAVIAGACFGLDFGENRPSFFYARPLSTPALFAGRIAALLGLVVVSIVAFLTVQWLSGLMWPADPMARIRREHVLVIAVPWSVALFIALAGAAHTRQRAKAGLRAFILGSVRMVGVLASTALMAGLFSDIMFHAYDNRTPILVLLASYVIAAFIASCAAIELGRTNRLRIMEVLNIAMYVHTTIAGIVMVFAWFYLLRLGPDAITSVVGGHSSPDGGVAYVAARVDRGGDRYLPRFRVDLSTGEVRRLGRGGLNASRDQLGHWHSRDGATQVWTDQTLILLRSARQLLRPSSPLHFQSRFDVEHSLALPNDLVLDFDWELIGFPMEILPSSGGDVFAFHWFDKAGPHLAFMSPARGQLSVVDPAAIGRTRRAWIFLPSGQLRAAFQHRIETVEEIQVADIDPATGKVTPVATAPMGRSGEVFSVRFDGSASRALVEAGPPNERRALLLTLDGSPPPTIRTLAAVKQVNLEAGLLADGRIAVIVRQPPTAELRLFSQAGEPLLTIPLGEGLTILGSEPFPNVLMVSTQLASTSVVRLFDTTTGRLLREVEGFRAPGAFLSWNSQPAPPASAGSRLLLKKETLYLLPSMTEAPRPLLPRP